jgi:uncharacterized protein
MRKAAANLLKHGISFEIARTVFRDPQILTIADVGHGNGEERAMLSVVYTWTEIHAVTAEIRMISARKATRSEIRQYELHI